MLEGIGGADGAFGFESGERVHFRPEVDRIPEFAFCDEAEPLMFFSQNVRATFFLNAFAIAIEQGGADVFALEG